MSEIQRISFLLISILLSAFFSGMEIAFVSVDKLRFEMDKGSGVSSKILSHFYRRPNNFISTMLVGNNIVLVIYGILMAGAIDQWVLDGLLKNEFVRVLIQTIISTLLILFVGEFLPKNIFKLNPNGALKIFAIPVFIFYIVLYPISLIASSSSYFILRLFGVRVNKDVENKAFTRVDLDYFVQSGIEKTVDKQDIENEVQIFQNALDFSNVKIRDCMVPRTDVVALDLAATKEELMNLFIETGLSKIIIYKDTIDQVQGYIHSSEMFRSTSGNWQSFVQSIPIVPDTMAASKLMKHFMSLKKTIAVVVDEFGGVSGIVALEDLVEEIFGEIEDEHDTSTYISKKISDTEFILSARLEIDKVNELYGLDLPESDQYQTVGGLILNYYQSLPSLHEEIKVGTFLFKILKVTTNKIELVRLNIVE